MLDKKISPMLAYTSAPFDSPRHIFEIKWDGTRCILFIKDKKIRLQNRRLADITYRYPELLGLYREVKAKNAILDGEVVVLSKGRPDFNKLQQREHISEPIKIDLLSQKMPATYIAFDLLFLNGKNCTHLPLIERKKILRSILQESTYLVESLYIEEKGKAFFKRVLDEGLEGIMAKSITSPYLIGKRSRHWLKIKPKPTAICYIIGYTEGKGAREAFFGSLALATYEEGRWVYRGRVGSGFSETDMELILSRLQGLRVNSPPYSGKSDRCSVGQT
ncbi:MAG: DNA ligase [Deltaproteobacteria bacterium]|nr:MAG: DNA ligase [Deltaproteobacteria bacterium]